MEIVKNRNRNAYTFANINLLGKCNANCYFCLGKDIAEKIDCENQANIYFTEWKNFEKFLDSCKELGIKKIYLTGQNIDSLQYKYFDELRDYLQALGFLFGIRTNGYLLEKKLSSVLLCNDEIGLTINSLNPETNNVIMGHSDIPKWNILIPQLKNCRVSLIPNRYNIHEMMDTIHYVSEFKNVRISDEIKINFSISPEEGEKNFILKLFPVVLLNEYEVALNYDQVIKFTGCLDSIVRNASPNEPQIRTFKFYPISTATVKIIYQVIEIETGEVNWCENPIIIETKLI